MGHPFIGIGISTQRRPEVLVRCVENVLEHTPEDARIIVLDDGSSSARKALWGLPGIERVLIIETTTTRGIAATKNRLLTELRDCKHIFLFDDDCWPMADEWWKPYVESPVPHMMFLFDKWGNGLPVGDDEVLHLQGHRAHLAARGCMLYIRGFALAVAGGMDEGYGRWGYEHGDWSNRIHNMSLTPYRYMDVANSHDLIYSMDMHLDGHGRTVPQAERNALVETNKKRHDANYDSTEMFPITNGVVLTCYYNYFPDIQNTEGRVHPSVWPSNFDRLLNLRRSLSSEHVRVFTNLPSDPQPFASPLHRAITTEQTRVAGWQRWFDYRDWLKANPHVDFVWMVDGSDVIALNPIWGMDEGVLYVGSERAPMDCAWMRVNHPHMDDWLAENRDAPLLNCGLVGGDRDIVLAFLDAMCEAYSPDTPYEMGAFNKIVHERFPYETGPQVHTPFKAFKTADAVARWAHK